MADAPEPTVLRTLETGRGTDDLTPVRDALTGARVVGFGEAVPGTRETALLAGRLLEMLVEELDVRVLALGAPEAPTVALDRYVAGERAGVGEALEAVADWRWNTGDVVRVLEWVRARNEGCSEGDRVRVVGVEPVTAAPAVTAVGTFLRVHDAALLDEVGEAILRLLPHRPGHPPLPVTVLDAAQEVAARVDASEAGATLRAHADALVRAARLATTPRPEVDAERGRIVADGVRRAAGEADRVLWWSHAHSVRTRPGTAGSRLRADLGEQYYAVAVLCGSGEFRATRERRVLRTSRTPTRHRLRPAPAGTLEAAVAGEGTRVLDLGGRLPAGVTTMRALPDPLPRGWRRVHESVRDGELDGVAHVARAREALVR